MWGYAVGVCGESGRSVGVRVEEVWRAKAGMYVCMYVVERVYGSLSVLLLHHMEVIHFFCVVSFVSV